MIEHHPEMGRERRRSAPVVAECDDGMLNDIQARAVTADDVVKLLDCARRRGSSHAAASARAPA